MARIENRVGVAAPASVVWSVIAEVERWPEWSTVYSAASGKPTIGGPLNLTVMIAGMKPMALPGRVIDWVPNEQLHWRIPLLAGAVNVLRYIEIEALNEKACILSNGEVQSGIGAGLVPGRIQRAIRDGFQAMNEAAKARAEALWREQAPEVEARAQLSEAG